MLFGVSHRPFGGFLVPSLVPPGGNSGKSEAQRQFGPYQIEPVAIRFDLQFRKWICAHPVQVPLVADDPSQAGDVPHSDAKVVPSISLPTWESPKPSCKAHTLCYHRGAQR